MAPAPASPTRERTALLAGWARRALEAEPAAWFETTLSALAGAAGERDLGRAPGEPQQARHLVLAPGDLEGAEEVRAGFDPAGLTVDQAARIAFLLAADRGDDAAFAARLFNLFRTADVSESIAYLRGLPLFPGGRALLPVATEGVRSAQVLVDYAHERWAAGRPVSPELWLCVGPFAEGPMLDDLARVLTTGTIEERAAARAALQASPSVAAGAILARHVGAGRRGP